MNNQSTPLQQKPSTLTYALTLLALAALTIAILISSYNDRNHDNPEPTPYTTVPETTTATNTTPVTANPLSHHARPTEPNND